MASPSHDELRLQTNYSINALEELRALAEADTINLTGIHEALIDALEGDYSQEVLNGFAAFRAKVSDALSRTTAFSMIAPHILNFGKLINSPYSNPSSIFVDLYDYYVSNSMQVEKRGFTFGTASAGGSNVGNGTIYRLNVDANGYDIDWQTADTKTATCIKDEHSGSNEHAEVFRIESQERTRDYLSLKGGTGDPASPPSPVDITCLSARNSLLRNPSFTNSDQSDSDYTADLATPGSTTGVTGWTLDATTNVQLDRNTYYRDSEGESDPQSLRFDGNAYVQQNLNVNRITVRETGINGFGQVLYPTFVQVAIYRGSSADGTVTLTFGSQTETLNVATVGNGSWTTLYLTLGTKNWFPIWNQEDPLLKIQLASNTTGYVLFDDVIVAPFTRFDGGWYAAVGGSTPFLKDDVFTFADTCTETGIVQKWFVRSGLGYLPGATSGSQEWDDPPPTPTPTATPTPTTTPTPTATPTPTPT